jgi:hypothetical protein
MKVGVSVEGLAKVQKELSKLQGERLRSAINLTLAQVGGRVAKNMRAEMPAVFDRPKPYTLRSVQVNPAGPVSGRAEIFPTYLGRDGIDPQQYLRAQALGGGRKLKRSELALQRAGILPAGYYTAIPKTPFPGSEDGFGNIRGPFVVQLLSYFQAFAAGGLRRNMGDKRKARIAEKGLSKQSFAKVGGVQFFVSDGQGSASMGGRTRKLQAGIWARTGPDGATLRPVLMFIRPPRYRVRLDMQAIAQKSQVGDIFERWLRGNIRDEYRAQVAAEAARDNRARP